MYTDIGIIRFNQNNTKSYIYINSGRIYIYLYTTKFNVIVVDAQCCCYCIGDCLYEIFTNLSSDTCFVVILDGTVLNMSVILMNLAVCTFLHTVTLMHVSSCP